MLGPKNLKSFNNGFSLRKIKELVDKGWVYEPLTKGSQKSKNQL
jgi:hypothetical protein